MSSELRDLEFLNTLAEEFFKQMHIRKTLMVIREENISGWEKWLQIEFSVFLRKYEEVKSWGRESPYTLDQRIAKAQQKCAVDFIIHQKRKHSQLALELKQIDSPVSCIVAMLKDIKKMWSIRTSEFDIRSVWCLGVHNEDSFESIHRNIVYQAGVQNIEIQPKMIVSKKIGKTGYGFTIF